jgi:hypothetical protein
VCVCDPTWHWLWRSWCASFTSIQQHARPQPTVQNIRSNMVQQQQASAANRRLAQQLANRPGLGGMMMNQYQQQPQQQQPMMNPMMNPSMNMMAMNMNMMQQQPQQQVSVVEHL